MKIPIFEDFIKNTNKFEINPCHLSDDKVGELNRFLEDLKLDVWRVKTRCPNYRITIQNWNEVSDENKEKIKQMVK